MRKAFVIGLLVVIVAHVDQLFAQEGALDEKIEKIGIEIADEPAFFIGSMKVTLGKAIELVLEQNRDTLSGAYDVAMADSAYRKFRNKYSPFLNIEGGGKYQEYPEAMGITAPEKERRLTASASIFQNFETGTSISAGISHEYNDSVLKEIKMGPMGSFKLGDPQYHRPVLFASLKQELLKNSFGYNDRRQSQILKNVAEMQKESIIYQLSGLVVGIVVDYWNMVIANSEVHNAELQLKETKKVRNIIADNVRLGLAEPFDLNYYNTLVAGAEATLANAKQKYKDAMRNLLSTLNLDENVTLTGSALLADKLPNYDIAQSLKAAYEKRADYKNALRAVENAELELELYRNQALPSLTAEVTVSSMGQKKDFPDAYGETSSATNPGLEAKLRMTYPLHDVEQQTNERDARFKLEKAKLQLEKYKRVVRDDVVSKYERIRTYHELYRKAQEARKQSEIYYARLLANLRKGRFTAAVVKNGLDAMVATRQRELEALVAFNISLLQFDIAKNELFEKYKIDVNKYIPK
ncbi:MAG: TolC family protein [Spirochaetes bacterium]|nr:TolC family protein [Spirochaetota bacterium]